MNTSRYSLSKVRKPYVVLSIVVVLLQMIGGIFGEGSPNPTIAFARELHLEVKPIRDTYSPMEDKR